MPHVVPHATTVAILPLRVAPPMVSRRRQPLGRKEATWFASAKTEIRDRSFCGDCSKPGHRQNEADRPYKDQSPVPQEPAISILRDFGVETPDLELEHR